LVAVKGLAAEPMMLLTSCSVNVKIKEAVWRIVETYLTRRKCEESFRYIKQCYNLEDIRVRRYTSIRNLVLPILAVAYFASEYLGDILKQKRGGHLTPRKVPMTQRLFEFLARRHEKRDPSKPWVFWQRYWDREKKDWVEGPYQDRKKFMKTLCKKAGVRYFRFHALRHLGASILDRENVNLGSIQRILGHENRTTIEIYLHSIGEAERDAMKVFDRLAKDSHMSPT
jgi:integrase